MTVSLTRQRARYLRIEAIHQRLTPSGGCKQIRKTRCGGLDTGIPDKPSYEAIWDGVLSAGPGDLRGGHDDSHNYHDFAPWLSNPGRGWVMVQADELTQEAIVDGLAAGRFYASTGVTLARLECSAESIALEIEQERDFIYTTRFTGKDGELLAESTGLTAEYRADGHEDYVRATVVFVLRTARVDTAGLSGPSTAWGRRRLGGLDSVPGLFHRTHRTTGCPSPSYALGVRWPG